MSSSFLDRLKKKAVVPTTPEDQKKDQVAAQVAKAPEEHVADQLHVDIYKADGAIIVFAQIAGANVQGLSVLIEGDGDIVTIKGERKKPNGEFFGEHAKECKDKILEECSWGPFYRQIILPTEVDATKTDAKIHDGVLMLLLPLKETKDTGVKIHITEV